jgi:translation initiation factor 1
MSKKKISGLGGLVYSTDPDFKIDSTDHAEQEILLPAQQRIKVRLDSKRRAGKVVTLVEGFTGSITEEETLGKNLKTFCGTGGSVKDGEIIIQGDNRDKVVQWLQKNGFTQTKKI